MKVLGLISSLSDPASRVRILQYEPYFSRAGEILSCKYFRPLRDSDPSAWALALKKVTGLNAWRTTDLVKTISRTPLLFKQTGFDLIWQNRLIQLHHSFWEKRLKKPVVFDFDDAIWMNEGEKQVRRKIQTATMVFAGNAYLADYSMALNGNTHIIPSTVDTEKLFPTGFSPERFTIGWIGTKSSFQYLEMIREPILDFMAVHKSVRLHIVSSERPPGFHIDNDRFVFRKWEAEKENEYINEFSAGIMPLDDTAWTRGKCSFKLLQYLACGKPVIASPVGMNKTIMKEADIGLAPSRWTDWRSAFMQLLQEPESWHTRGINGRKLVEEKYSCRAWAKPIIEKMKSLI